MALARLGAQIVGHHYRRNPAEEAKAARVAPIQSDKPFIQVASAQV